MIAQSEENGHHFGSNFIPRLWLTSVHALVLHYGAADDAAGIVIIEVAGQHAIKLQT